MTNKLLLPAIVAVLLALFSFNGQALAKSSDGESWAIYMYFCGTDLETKAGAASADLFEMLEVDLPENVKLVIQTGGTKSWQNDFVDSSKLCRLVVDSNGLRMDSKLPLRNMGDEGTLEDFLDYCLTQHPADRVGFIFWNHGGGSLYGICNDELNNGDALDLAELYRAFRAKMDENADEPFFEFVGFDACLMASLDTATMFHGIAKYMVASEEIEPGNGWYYTDWLQNLADNPAISTKDLCIAICDSYMEGCEMVGTEEVATLSVVDLGHLLPLQRAFSFFSLEGFLNVMEDPTAFFASYARNSAKAESYGEGKYGMVDMGDLVRQNASLFPVSSQDVLNALQEAVVYNVKSPYREFATGISCYYPQTKDVKMFNTFYKFSTTPATAYLYELMLTGKLSEQGVDFYAEFIENFAEELMEPKPEQPATPQLPLLSPAVLTNLAQSIPQVPASPITQLEDHPVKIKDGAWAVLELGPEMVEQLETVQFLLAKVIDEKTILFMGQDNDVDIDWEKGVFTDNFRGVWGGIDGHLVYMEVNYECDDYVLYDVPVLINDKSYMLKVAYHYKDEKYSMLIATPIVESGQPAPKEQYLLRAGDKITTLLMYMDTEKDDYDYYESETFTYQANSSFEEIELEEGHYLFVFDIYDYRGDSALSEMVFVTIDQEGEISIENLN